MLLVNALNCKLQLSGNIDVSSAFDSFDVRITKNETRGFLRMDGKSIHKDEVLWTS